MKMKLILVASALSVAALSHAVLLNEIFVNAPGEDNGNEFFELSGDAGASLSGYWFLSIDGDGSAAGVIDQALDLSNFSLGSNGLFLWRDSSTALNQPPAAGTTVHVADFAPDLENGSNTFLLVQGFTGSVGADLDADKNGSLDSTPWATLVDGIGYSDGGSSDFNYGPSIFAPLLFTPDLVARTGLGWTAMDVLGTFPGPFTFDPAEQVFLDGSAIPGWIGAAEATPGNVNPEPIPEPATMVALAIGAAMAARKRRKS